MRIPKMLLSAALVNVAGSLREDMVMGPVRKMGSYKFVRPITQAREKARRLRQLERLAKRIKPEQIA